MSMTSFATKNYAQIDMNETKLNYIVGKIPNLSAAQVKQMVQLIEDTALDKTIKDCENWIKTYVPKATGQLQDNLLQNLKSSNRHGMKAVLKLGTSIYYAPYVNRFRTSNVRHTGQFRYVYYYGFHGKISLNDPKAVGGYWGLLRQYAKQRFKIHLRDAIRSNTGGVGAKPFSDQMKVT